MWFRSNLGKATKEAFSQTVDEMGNDVSWAAESVKNNWTTPLTKAKAFEAGTNALSFLPWVKWATTAIKTWTQQWVKQVVKNWAKNVLWTVMAVDNVTWPITDIYQWQQLAEYGAINDWYNNSEEWKKVKEAWVPIEFVYNHFKETYPEKFQTMQEKNTSAWWWPWYENVWNAVTSALNTVWEWIWWAINLGIDAVKFVPRVINNMNDIDKWYAMGTSQKVWDELVKKYTIGPAANKIVEWWNRFSL